MQSEMTRLQDMRIVIEQILNTKRISLSLNSTHHILFWEYFFLYVLNASVISENILCTLFTKYYFHRLSTVILLNNIIINYEKRIKMQSDGRCFWNKV